MSASTVTVQDQVLELVLGRKPGDELDVETVIETLGHKGFADPQAHRSKIVETFQLMEEQQIGVYVRGSRGQRTRFRIQPAPISQVASAAPSEQPGLGPVPADCDGRVALDWHGRPYYRRRGT